MGTLATDVLLPVVPLTDGWGMAALAFEALLWGWGAGIVAFILWALWQWMHEDTRR